MLLIASSLPFTGTKEHLVVHGEVTDGDLTWQSAHPGGHPHHPVQHDPDKGRFVPLQSAALPSEIQLNLR